MGTRKPSKPYLAELRERAVRLVREQEAICNLARAIANSDPPKPG